MIMPVHTIIVSKDAIFDKVWFSLNTRPKDLHQNTFKEIDLQNQSSPQDDQVKMKDDLCTSIPYLYGVEGDSLTYSEAMTSSNSNYGRKPSMIRCIPLWKKTLGRGI